MFFPIGDDNPARTGGIACIAHIAESVAGFGLTFLFHGSGPRAPATA